jgi:hypothetical protein
MAKIGMDKIEIQTKSYCENCRTELAFIPT